VQTQSFSDIEYIIIDGGSSDKTAEIARSFVKTVSVIISEPDNGIYEAINKGIRLATGDIVGILNSDDFFYNDRVLERVAREFNDPTVDAVFGDAVFVKTEELSKIVRYYSSKSFRPWMFRLGFMPAHTTFFCRKVLFERLGYYRTDYRIAADFELLLRFIYLNKIKCKYISEPLVIMRAGGISNKNYRSRFLLNREILRACRTNGLITFLPLIYMKYFLKIFDYFPCRIAFRQSFSLPSFIGNAK
jgi:glycosyltransferase involved in cell wall biosynthesis